MSESRGRWVLPGLVGALTVAALAGAGAVSAQRVEVVPGGDGRSVYVVGTEHHSAYLGVRLEEETEWAEGGARVSSVVDGSPADEAGLEAGDIVVSFEGNTIRGPVALTRAIHEKAPGDTVELRVIREGREKGLTAELGDRAGRTGFNGVFPGQLEWVTPEVDEELRDKVERGLEYLVQPRVEVLAPCDAGEDCSGFNYRFSWGGGPRLGVQLVDTTPELRQHLGSTDGSGILVSKVLRGTPAEYAGVQVGDLIVRVGESSIEDVSDLREALSERAGQSFEVEVIRDRKKQTLEATLPETDSEAVTGPRAALPAPPAPAHPPTVAPVAPVRVPAAPAPPPPPPPRARIVEPV